MTLRIGIVGAGRNTKLRHIPGFRELHDVEITGVANRSLESSRRAAEEFGIPRAFEDWRAVVESDEIDAVMIGTWPYMHCPVTLAALAAGKHVLTEARMAMDLAEARRMQEAAQATDKVAMIVPAPFYLEYEPTLLAMIEEGAFGDLLEIQVSGMGGGWDPEGPLHWRHRRDLSGNNIMSMGILNETVRRYAGHERCVVAHAKTFIAERQDQEAGERKRADIPDSLGIVAEHEGGAICTYHLSGVARHGRNGTFEFYGTKGAFRLENGKAWIARAEDRGFGELEVAPERRGGWRVERDFVEAIREGKPVTHTSFADGIRYMEFTEAVQQSLATGRRVTLPLS